MRIDVVGLIFVCNNHVDGKAAADGDTVTVYANTVNPGESTYAIKRAKPRAVKDYTQADAFHN